MAVKLLRAIANKDEKLAIDLLENDKSLALMNIDLIDQTGYPLHHAASHVRSLLVCKPPLHYQHLHPIITTNSPACNHSIAYI